MVNISIEQVFTISWNIVLGIAILFLIYILMKRWTKRFMLEALHEYEEHKRKADVMSRVQAVRQKYGN